MHDKTTELKFCSNCGAQIDINVEICSECGMEIENPEFQKQSDLPKEILDQLYSGEDVRFCIKKRYGLEVKPKFLIISDRRVIFLDQKILGRYDLKDIPYQKLEDVHFEEGIVASKFQLKGKDGDSITINWLDKTECKEAIVTIRDAINAIAIEPISLQKKKKLVGERWTLHKPKELITRSIPATRVAETTKHQSEPKDDPIEKIKKLKELKDMDLISEEEFEEKRRKLLEEI